MSYQALYRQWRPLKFSEVVGQEAVVRTLKNQLEAGRIAHAYLFCGCRGTGKTTIARIMSRAINCKNPEHGEPCGECEPCRAILAENTLDVTELDAASNNSVDDVRDLMDKVHYPAQLGKYKVYIIDEVHMLSASAFNALLKTLEEPPEHVVFILATTEPQKLPATILSRVQRYDFGRIPLHLIEGRLRQALGAAGLKAEDAALASIARAAEGAMRDAFSILDICVSGAGGAPLTEADVRAVLGSADRDFLFAFADNISRRDTAGVMRMTDELMRSGREPQVFLRDLTRHFRALLITKTVKQGAEALLELTSEDESRCEAQAEGFSEGELLYLTTLFMRAEGETRYASSPRIALEITALRACQGIAFDESAELAQRIADVENALKALMSAPRAAAAPAPEKPAAPMPVKAKPEPVPAPETPEKPAAPAPAEGGDVWKRAMEHLKKNDPSLYGLLHGSRLLGVENDRYRVEIPYEKKGFTYDRLAQPPRRDTLSSLITEIAGAPRAFEAVLAQSAEHERLRRTTDSVQTDFLETFGRGAVQIDEGTDDN